MDEQNITWATIIMMIMIIIHYHVINMYEAFLHVHTVDGCGYTGYVVITLQFVNFWWRCCLWGCYVCFFHRLDFGDEKRRLQEQSIAKERDEAVKKARERRMADFRVRNKL